MQRLRRHDAETWPPVTAFSQYTDPGLHSDERSDYMIAPCWNRLPEDLDASTERVRAARTRNSAVAAYSTPNASASGDFQGNALAAGRVVCGRRALQILPGLGPGTPFAHGVLLGRHTGSG